VYRYDFTSDCVPGRDFNLDKKIANEVFMQSSFIEFYPTKERIWGITSLRQLMLCSDPFATNLQFEHYNSIFNVMSMCASRKHQVACKMVKQLDQ
jgi:hypothetical protein